MIQMRLALALLAALPLAAAAADPPAAPVSPKRAPVVAVLDMDKVLAGSTLAQQLQGRLKGLEESIRGQLDPMSKTIQQKQADFDRNQATMTPEQRTKEAETLRSMDQQFQMAQRQAQEAYTQQREALANQMRDAINPVIEALAKEQGWDMVMSRPGTDVLWAAEWLDASALVVERLNALPPKAPPSMGAAPAPKAETKPEPKPKT